MIPYDNNQNVLWPILVLKSNEKTLYEIQYSRKQKILRWEGSRAYYPLPRQWCCKVKGMMVANNISATSILLNFERWWRNFKKFSLKSKNIFFFLKVFENISKVKNNKKRHLKTILRDFRRSIKKTQPLKKRRYEFLSVSWWQIVGDNILRTISRFLFGHQILVSSARPQNTSFTKIVLNTFIWNKVDNL